MLVLGMEEVGRVLAWVVAHTSVLDKAAVGVDKALEGKVSVGRVHTSVLDKVAVGVDKALEGKVSVGKVHTSVLDRVAVGKASVDMV